jgi:hypothetical protein
MIILYTLPQIRVFSPSDVCRKEQVELRILAEICQYNLTGIPVGTVDQPNQEMFVALKSNVQGKDPLPLAHYMDCGSRCEPVGT